MHLAKEKLRFLDPFVVAQDPQRHPLQWDDKHDELLGCKTAKA
jgi:hypothetical protein